MTTSAAPNGIWQQIFHYTLYRLSNAGAELVLSRFRSSHNIDSATCTYDHEDHHFEISCMLADGQKAEEALIRIVTDVIQDDITKAKQFSNHKRKVLRFPESVLDDVDEIDDEDFSSDQKDEQESVKLIELDYSIKRDSWTPSDPATAIESFCNPNLLQELGDRNGCMLSLDLSNRSVVIKAELAYNVEAVKRRLDNLEQLSTGPAVVYHSLRLHSSNISLIQFHRFWEKKETNPFNEDRSLSRLLVPEDSLLVEGDCSEKARKLDRLQVLRCYERTPAGSDPKPNERRGIVKSQPPANTAARRAFRCTKFNDIGNEPSTAPPSPKRIQSPTTQFIQQWIENDSGSSSRPTDSDPKVEPPVQALNSRNDLELTPNPWKAPENLAARTSLWNTSNTKLQKPAASPNQQQLRRGKLTNSGPPTSNIKTDNSVLRSNAPRFEPQNRSKPVNADSSSRAVRPKQSQKSKAVPVQPTKKEAASTNRFSRLIDIGSDDDEDEEDVMVSDEGGDSYCHLTRHEVDGQQAAAPNQTRANRTSKRNTSQSCRSDAPNESAETTNSDSQNASTAPSGIETMATEQANNPGTFRPRLTPAALGEMLPKAYQALERARPTHGTISMVAQIGQIVVKDLPKQSRDAVKPKEFQRLVQPLQRFDSIERSFSNLVSTSIVDMDSILEALGIGDQAPLHLKSFFEFSCRTSNGSFIRIVIDALNSATEPFLKTSENLHGAFYSHHPQHFWDSRFLITSHTKLPLSGYQGAEAFVKNLCIRKKDDAQITPSVEGKDGEGLEVHRCRLYTIARWNVTAALSPNIPLYVETTRVTDLKILRSLTGPGSERAAAKGSFRGGSETEKQMAKENRFWYEVSLGFKDPVLHFRHNEPYPDIVDPGSPTSDHAEVDTLAYRMDGLELGEKADWKPEQVLTEMQLLAICDVATKLVERIDNVGAGNEGLGWNREENLINTRKETEKAADVFW